MNEKQSRPALPGRVSRNEEADSLWRRQYQLLEEGTVLAECLLDENLRCLSYYGLTVIIGRALEQIGRAGEVGNETNLKRLFTLTGKAFPYLGYRWAQSGKAKKQPNWKLMLTEE